MSGGKVSWLQGVLVGLVALMHFYFLVLEMFLWTKPLGLKTFRNSPEKAETTKVLAANQGLYNGFLSAGLVWGLAHPDAEMGPQIQIFFLLCVIVAGIYGAYSVSRRIFFVQSLPALAALGIVMFFLSVSHAQVTYRKSNPSSAYPEQIQKRVKENLGAFQACYREEIDRNPQFSAEIKIQWTINEKGHVVKSRIENTSTRAELFEKCLLTRVENIVVAPPPDGKSYDTEFPLVFKLKKHETSETPAP